MMTPHRDPEELSSAHALLQSFSEILRLPLNLEARARLLRYCEELLRWNSRTNLTGAKTLSSFVAGPLFDALTLLTVFEPQGRLLDVGSGAGLPGLPAALVHEGLRVTLLEPRPKRTAFLRHAVHALGLTERVEVREGKDKNVGEERWDSAVAQAVWEPSVWLDRARNLVRPGGAVYLLASRLDEDAVPDSGLEVEKRVDLLRPADRAPRIAVRARLP